MPCGLRIIGTERHESRRIDRQLRGRSGRQGDPGASQFFLSLEDDLMRLFGSERIAKVMTTLGVQEGEVIQHPMVTKAIERAQKRVEAHNFDIRKHLLEYDDVMNQQREVIYAQRLNILEGGDLTRRDRRDLRRTSSSGSRRPAPTPATIQETWDLEGLKDDMRRTFLVDVDFSKTDVAGHHACDPPREPQEGRDAGLPAPGGAARPRSSCADVERLVFLQVVDKHWRDHLYELDRLSEGIGLRAYGQKDPLLEYKAEAFDMFMGADRVDPGGVGAAPVPRAGHGASGADEPRDRRDGHSIRTRARPRSRRGRRPTSTTPAPQFGSGSQSAAHRRPAGCRCARPDGAARRARTAETASGADPVKVDKKVGRNDPCPCGSGKKYKKCCGQDS